MSLIIRVTSVARYYFPLFVDFSAESDSDLLLRPAVFGVRFGKGGVG